MDLDLTSINTQNWTNIPPPLTQAITLLLKVCQSNSNFLKTVNKEAWCSEIASSVTTLQTSFLKEYEEKSAFELSSKFQSIKDTLSVEMQVFKKQVRHIFDEVSQDLQGSKIQFNNYYKSFKSELVSLRDIVLSTKESIKTELACKYIKPEHEMFRLEFTELTKNFVAIEKQIKLLNLQFDRFSCETNSRFDIQRDDIKQNSFDIQTINKRFNYIVENATETLRNDFEKFKEFAEGVQGAFKEKEHQFWVDFEQKSENLFSVLDNRKQEMMQIHAYIKEGYEKMQGEQEKLREKCDCLERDVHFQLDSLRVETNAIVFKAYEESREKLMQNYREDLKYLKSKLDWLPSTSQELSDLSPLEARLFILESRLRREENNRIMQKTEIIQGNP